MARGRSRGDPAAGAVGTVRRHVPPRRRADPYGNPVYDPIWAAAAEPGLRSRSTCTHEGVGTSCSAYSFGGNEVTATATATAIRAGGDGVDLADAWRFVFHYALAHVLAFTAGTCSTRARSRTTAAR